MALRQKGTYVLRALFPKSGYSYRAVMISFSSEEQAASWLHFPFIDPNLLVKLSISSSLIMLGPLISSCLYNRRSWLMVGDTSQQQLITYMVHVATVGRTTRYQWWLVPIWSRLVFWPLLWWRALMCCWCRWCLATSGDACNYRCSVFDQTGWNRTRDHCLQPSCFRPTSCISFISVCHLEAIWMIDALHHALVWGSVPYIICYSIETSISLITALNYTHTHTHARFGKRCRPLEVWYC